MTSLKTAAVSGLLILTSGVAAHAATLQNYTIHAEGRFAALGYGGLYSYDQATSAFETHRNLVFTDADNSSLDGHYLADSLRATRGSARLQYDIDADPNGGNATITGCTGFLTFLCAGAVQAFDAAAQTLRSFSVNAHMTTLTPDALVYETDALVDWTAGSTSFFNSGGVQTVSFAISSLDIDLQPVPLPASLAFLLASIAALACVRPPRLSPDTPMVAAPACAKALRRAA